MLPYGYSKSNNIAEGPSLVELNKSNQSIGDDSSSDLAKSQWDETKVNDKVDVASSAIDQDKDTEVEKSADKAKASRLKKLVASVAIGLTLAVSGGVHAYQQHVENQRAAEVAEEEREDNERRQKFLDQIPQDDELRRDEHIYNEADRVLRHDVVDWYEVNPSEGNVPYRARLKSPKEFEECFHITPEDYQKQCLEKYGINADDFADDTKAEAQQRFDEAKRIQDEYAAKLGDSERRERSSANDYCLPEDPGSRRIRALQNGDISYFKKSKESKVKQALEDKINELEYEALCRKHNERDIEEYSEEDGPKGGWSR